MRLSRSQSLPRFEEFNEQLLEWCEKDADRLHYKHKVPIRELWEEDKAALLELPQYPFSVFRYSKLVQKGFGHRCEHLAPIGTDASVWPPGDRCEH